MKTGLAGWFLAINKPSGSGSLSPPVLLSELQVIKPSSLLGNLDTTFNQFPQEIDEGDLTTETTLASSFLIGWDPTGDLKRFPADGVGDLTTASNVNVGGVGVFKQKTGSDLEFYGLNAGTNTTVALDAGNNEIEVSVPDGSTTVKGAVELATDGENAANVVVQGNDARLSDARTPTGAAGGDLTGTYPNPTIGPDTVGTDELDYFTAGGLLLGSASSLPAPAEITPNTGLEISGTNLNVTNAPLSALANIDQWDILGNISSSPNGAVEPFTITDLSLESTPNSGDLLMMHRVSDGSLVNIDIGTTFKSFVNNALSLTLLETVGENAILMNKTGITDDVTAEKISGLTEDTNPGSGTRLLGESSGGNIRHYDWGDTLGVHVGISAPTNTPTGRLWLDTDESGSAGAGILSVAEISTTTTLDSTYMVVLCETTSAGFTVTLPAASTNTGRHYWIKNIGSNAVTVDGNASETIDGATTLTVIGGSNDSVEIVCDGTEWWVI